MLQSLSIRDFALIRELRIHFHKGLSVISGETGSGKSILLEAIGQISGQRANREMVREGADVCLIEAVFSDIIGLLPPSLRESLALSADELDENQLILSREIDRDGRSTARINGRQTSVSLLRECARCFVAVHAQNEQITLFENDTQQRLLDRYCGDRLLPFLQRWRKLRENRLAGARKLKQLGLNTKERAARLDLLRFQIREIEEAAFQPGEAEKLKERNSVLSSGERIGRDLYSALAMLSPESENSAISILQKAASELNYASRHSREYEALKNQIIQNTEDLSSVCRRLLDFARSLEGEAGEAERVRDRLELWHKLSRKYGEDEASLYEFLEAAKSEERLLVNSEEEFRQIRQRLLEEEKEAAGLASEIHAVRKRASAELSRAIGAQLQNLSMPHVRFDIQVNELPPGSQGYWGENGRDQVAFYFSPNVGEKLLPLEKIASGGEASRVLLAMKSIFADLDEIPVLIFDEIDSGIGGEAAAKAARVMADLALGRQVLSVTHSAQISAHADNHYLVYKERVGSRTESNIKLLDHDERVTELARMLAGDSESNEAKELALALLQAKQ